jgi:hypothetical protein
MDMIFFLLNMDSNIFVANVDKMGSSVPKQWCSFIHIISFNDCHYMAAKCSERQEVLFRIYTHNEKKKIK